MDTRQMETRQKKECRNVSRKLCSIWRIPESDNFHADGITYAKIDVLNIELYSDEKDWNNEKKIEDILDKYGITYDKTGEYLDSEKMYEVLYEMEV